MDKFQGTKAEFAALISDLSKFTMSDMGWQLYARGADGAVAIFFVNRRTVLFQGRPEVSARIRQRFIKAAGGLYEEVAPGQKRKHG